MPGGTCFTPGRADRHIDVPGGVTQEYHHLDKRSSNHHLSNTDTPNKLRLQRTYTSCQQHFFICPHPLVGRIERQGKEGQRPRFYPVYTEVFLKLIKLGGILMCGVHILSHLTP